MLGAGCTQEQEQLFTRLSPDQTGVDFANNIPKDDSLMNPLDFFYVYNGGGVAIGDVNGDGRPDLYFTGNTVENRLYLNEGDLQFRVVTDSAGVAAPNVWSTGVTLADVNQDGRTDIYVSVGGPSQKTADRANRLYINQGVGRDGVPTFEERAESFGIADAGYTTHSAFFDADQDGDLDLYVLNTATIQRGGRPGRRPQDRRSSDSNRDRLYQNNGEDTYTNISEQAGITETGYGLGVAIGDVNGDGWPDIYAANDLYSNDLLYVNDGDGTFTNRTQQCLKHLSYSAMGVDLADVNHDARQDIMVLDMLPKEHDRRRLISNVGARPEGIWQYGRNTLQLNNGPTPNGGHTFSDVAQLADVEASGWSWAPLLADFDNDGDRDLFVSNGYGELVTHLDFVRRRQQVSFSGSPDQRHDTLIKAMKDLPEAHLPNNFFENVGSAEQQTDDRWRFADRTGQWASERPGISNGTAFADLDGDGDLDLVTNNIDAPATILENHTTQRSGANALRIELRGPDDNQGGLGAEVRVMSDDTTQYRRHSRYRGYQSTVESPIHFGLGTDSTADSVRVVWPDSATQVLTDVAAGQTVELKHAETTPASTVDKKPSPDTVRSSSLFREVASRRGVDYRHAQTDVNDFKNNPLLPHRFSEGGPGIAVGDVDGNGLDDVFVGAVRGQERTLYRQVAPGQFETDTLPFRYSYSGQYSYEDRGALFFDADGDGDQDLYVVSGGNTAAPESKISNYQDRLYLNDGNGNFEWAKDALPDVQVSGSVVTASDYDQDGDLDLFVGGRWIPREYPRPPRSLLLRNDSSEDNAQFTDVTKEAAPALAKVGLVTDALWTDFNNDQEIDLLVVGEWMPITFFENQGGQFENVTSEMGLPETSGWWNSIVSGDFDRDGDTDYVAGNLGLNTRYEASPEEPVRVHAKDFDNNGSIDPVITRYMGGTAYPAHGRRELTDKINTLFARTPSQQIYAGATFDDLFREEELEGAYVAEAARFETSYLEHQDDGTFAIRDLPMRAQTAPVFGMRAGDYNADGKLDLLMVGNKLGMDHETGQADAFVGAYLQGDGTGQFTSVGYTQTGFFVDGDARGLAEVATGDTTSLILATQNGDSLKAFAPSRRRGQFISVRPLDQYAILTYEDGTTRKEELNYGSTYLSQSSRALWVPSTVTKVVIYRARGSRERKGAAFGKTTERQK